jgi:hypothetical protein
MSCCSVNIEITDNLVRISNLFSQSMIESFTRKRYGIKKCGNVVNADLAYDVLNLYKRSLERDACNICDDNYCCTSQIEERINTL